MKLLYPFLAFSLLLFITACSDDETTASEAGVVEVEFDNIALVNGIQQQLSLVDPGNDDYDYTNAVGQSFNINLLRYYITDIHLEGPNGESYRDEISVDVNQVEGIHLIDESDQSSGLLVFDEVPAGNYNKITFTVGVPEEGVQEGAAGGVLDPASCNMFWNWNSGYIAMKFEGQSPVSNGGTSGTETLLGVDNGIAYHVGGWRDVENTPFVFNNKTITLDFDTMAKVEKGQQPHIHLTMNVLGLFTGVNDIDFTGNHNVHKPIDGKPVAENIPAAFAYDHVHQ